MPLFLTPFLGSQAKVAYYPKPAAHSKTGRVDKTIRIYTSHKEMKADEYRYWQSRPAHERMDAVSEMSLAAYALRSPLQDVPRLQRPLVCLPRPRKRDLAGIEEIQATEDSAQTGD